MQKINVLDQRVANMIAAGEVVERPASVIKELVENAVDAGARSITVEIKNGGISYIRVSDDGCGISPEDAVTAFQRHATSKIRNVKDLESILTLGFRGEALASIAAVSQVELITKTQDSDEGIYVSIQAGKVTEKKSIGCPQGTTLVVRNLFFNTPARMKFLKKDTTEAGYISDIIDRLVLGHPEISFRFINNGKEVIFTSGDNKLINCIYSLYGKDYAKSMLPVNYNENGIQVSGFAGKPDIARANRSMQSFFINGRYIKSNVLTYAVEEAYKNQLTVNKFPVAILHLNFNPSLVDVNVHPTKMEVKFSDEKQIYQAVYWAVKNALYARPNIPEMAVPKKNIFEYKVSEKDIPILFDKKSHIQQEINTYTVAADQSINFQKSDIKKNDISNEINNGEKEVEPEKSAVVQEGSSKQYKIIGQLFNTYILVEKDEEVLLIDQHAAHERLGYEKLLQRYKSRQIYPQTLLVPVVLQLSKVEMNIALENSAFFKAIGFEFEDFGNNSVMIREVPVTVDDSDIKNLFIEIIELLKNSKNEPITEKEYHALYTIACKAAVKANKNMHMKEMEQLVSDLLKLENINTCPHGRPIIISMSKYYIEKQFKRVM